MDTTKESRQAGEMPVLVMTDYTLMHFRKIDNSLLQLGQLLQQAVSLMEQIIVSQHEIRVALTHGQIARK